MKSTTIEGRKLELAKEIIGEEVRIIDDTNFQAGRSNNGGCYRFWTRYYPRLDGRWDVSFHTSADFDFCSRCGDFGQHRSLAYLPSGEAVWEDFCPEPEPVNVLELVNEILEVEADTRECSFYPGEKAITWGVIR